MVGVYKISCLANGKFYIGSSSNINKRWTCHRSNLNKNKHHNQPLQNAWIKYGADNFNFELIELCSISELQIREEYYLSIGFEYNNLFNIFKNAYSLRAENHPMYGKTHTEEARLLIKQARAKQVISHSPETRKKIGRPGKLCDPEHIKKMVAARNGKAWNKGIKTGISPKNKKIFSEQERDKIISQYSKGNSIESIRKDMGVSWDVICQFLKENKIETRNISQQKNMLNAKRNTDNN